MKLKICGMKYKDNTTEVAQLQPDYLGFIFYENSSRFFDGNIPELPKSIKKTGVFVNASLEFIIEKIKTHNLQAVQLHGSESPEFCDTLRHAELVSVSHHEKLEIIKVFSIKDNFDFSVLEAYEAVCDYFLFDTKGKLPGGNGYTFNWDVLKDYPSTKPFFLSGGIGLNEIDQVLLFLQKQESRYCHAIDVNSKFEIEAGLKDTDKIKRFKKLIQA
ncbi:phosphoribosylanthranilate isomerase [Psychroserpens luteus]|uniref:N-(5'-phosphoribosyl)anthranilate isomerase n=1 Tax=Psychroserpens luteus TaxID=1434066 RepID=A0ABW5ZTH5_9FLAO|nr:phosphoribosylanthranilate isomerase [Psychroserpens luteus]